MVKKKAENVEKKDVEVSKPKPGSVEVNVGNIQIITVKLLEVIAKNTAEVAKEMKLLRESIK